MELQDRERKNMCACELNMKFTISRCLGSSDRKLLGVGGHFFNLLFCQKTFLGVELRSSRDALGMLLYHTQLHQDSQSNASASQHRPLMRARYFIRCGFVFGVCRRWTLSSWVMLTQLVVLFLS
jgi:hypothetical protein